MMPISITFLHYVSGEMYKEMVVDHHVTNLFYSTPFLPPLSKVEVNTTDC